MTSFYTPLEQEALLHIAGPDTQTFLQGQVTCDVRQLGPDRALLGAYCTPQGRVVCDFLLCQLAPEHCALRLRRDISEQSAATFGKYIIFSKAEVDAGGDAWQLLGCWGPDAAADLRAVFGVAPAGQLASIVGQGFALVQMDDQGRQFECYLQAGHRDALLEQLAARLKAGTESDWQALGLRGGIGRIEAPTSGEFIPQMLNYDLTGHVSFSKGCYTGQEVVARMHYRGKPKRRMYLASATAGLQITAGTPLYSGAEQSVGNVVNSCQAEGLTLALVVATVDGAASGLACGAPDGPALTIGQLPYPLAEE